MRTGPDIGSILVELICLSVAIGTLIVKVDHIGCVELYRSPAFYFSMIDNDDSKLSLFYVRCTILG